MSRKDDLLKQKEAADRQWADIMRQVKNAIVPDRNLVVMVMDLCNSVDQKFSEEKYKELI